MTDLPRFNADGRDLRFGPPDPANWISRCIDCGRTIEAGVLCEDCEE